MASAPARRDTYPESSSKHISLPSGWLRASQPRLQVAAFRSSERASSQTCARALCNAPRRCTRGSSSVKRPAQTALTRPCQRRDSQHSRLGKPQLRTDVRMVPSFRFRPLGPGLKATARKLWPFSSVFGAAPAPVPVRTPLPTATAGVEGELIRDMKHMFIFC